jgi:hypothetical protein
MPKTLYDRLKAAAGESEGGMSEVVRTALEASLRGEAPDDPNVRVFSAALARAMRILDDAYGSWRNSPYTTEVLSRLAALFIEPTDHQKDAKPPAARPGSAIDKALSVGAIGKEPNAEQMAWMLWFWVQGIDV